MDLYRFELYAMSIISITLDACWISFHFDLSLFNIDFDPLIFKISISRIFETTIERSSIESSLKANLMFPYAAWLNLIQE